MPKYVNKNKRKMLKYIFSNKISINRCTVHSVDLFALKFWKPNLHSKIIVHFHLENSRLKTTHAWQIPWGKRKQGVGDHKRAVGTESQLQHSLFYNIYNRKCSEILNTYSLFFLQLSLKLCETAVFFSVFKDLVTWYENPASKSYLQIF